MKLLSAEKKQSLIIGGILKLKRPQLVLKPCANFTSEI
jgi:hypothetical protein